MKSLKCLFGFHKYDKILVAKIIKHGKTHEVHRRICLKCGYQPPTKDIWNERICGKW